jgi:hypothetical protein
MTITMGLFIVAMTMHGVALVWLFSTVKAMKEKSGEEMPKHLAYVASFALLWPGFVLIISETQREYDSASLQSIETRIRVAEYELKELKKDKK